MWWSQQFVHRGEAKASSKQSKCVDGAFVCPIMSNVINVIGLVCFAVIRCWLVHRCVCVSQWARPLRKINMCDWVLATRFKSLNRELRSEYFVWPFIFHWIIIVTLDRIKPDVGPVLHICKMHSSVGLCHFAVDMIRTRILCVLSEKTGSASLRHMFHTTHTQLLH